MSLATATVPGLTFEPASHVYRFQGKRVPSVTQLLQSLSKFALASPEALAAACERGTYVHRMTELHDLGELDEPLLPAQWLPYLAGWKQFLHDSGARWLSIEEQLYSRIHGYAGTEDRFGELAKWSPGVLWDLDIKTGRAPSRHWGLQTAAYRQQRIEKDAACIKNRRATVQLTGNGTYRFLPWDSPTDWPVFQALITLHHYGDSQ